MRRPHRSRAEHGGTTLVNLFWLLLLGVGVYFGIMYVPVWMEQWDVKTILQDVANSNWKWHDKELLRGKIVQRCKAFNKEGAEELFVLDPEDVEVDDNETSKQLTLRITWTRIIPYPFLQKQTQKSFTKEFVLDTTAVKW